MGRRKCDLVTRGLLMGCASWVLLLIKFKITVLFFFEIKNHFFGGRNSRISAARPNLSPQKYLNFFEMFYPQEKAFFIQ